MSASSENAKATLFSDWNPEKVIPDSEHGGDEFMQYMYKLHQKSSQGTGPVLIQMPWTINNHGGIPGTHFKGEPKQGHENQGKCAYYKRNFNPDNKEDTIALKKWQKFDENIGSDKVKKLLWKKEAKNYLYVPCVRKTRAPPAKKGEDAKKTDFPWHIKVKVKTVYHKPEKKGKKGKTSKKEESEDEKPKKKKDKKGSDSEEDDHESKDPDFISDRVNFSQENPKVLTKFRLKRTDGKKGYKAQDVQTIPEARKLMRRRCGYRDTIQALHIWEMKAPNRAGQIEYGVAIKAWIIDIVPAKPGGGASINEDCVVTEDDGTDEEDSSKKGSKKDKKKASSDDEDSANSDSDADEKPKKKNSKKDASDDEASGSGSDDGSEDGSGSDSDSGKKKPAVKKGKKDESEDESGSGSDSDSGKKKPPAKKGSKKGESEDDEDGSGSDAGSGEDGSGSDEEEAPKKPAKGKAAPAKKGGKKK